MVKDFIDRIKNLNWFFVFAILFLTFVGVVMIYSATLGMKVSILIPHLIKIFLGVILMIFVGTVNVDFWRKNGYFLYFFGLLLLCWATFYGFLGKGSRRWISVYNLNFQPSELMKIFVIISLAKFFDEKKIQNSKDYFSLILPIILVCLPVLLIFIQPDLGTAIIILFISFIVFFAAGLSWKFFITIFSLFLMVTPYLWSYLKDYQKNRILTLFNPENDPLGSGYHIIQSQIAIGSGGFFGKGWLKGSQSHLDFLPEKHTDFIFSMLGEEFGFIGTVSVIGLITVITSVGYRISNSLNQTNFNRLLGLGIISNFFFAAIINMSMVIGVLPVVGLPFPLVSYGGSSMVTYFIGFGIILSLHRSLSLQNEDSSLINTPFRN